MWSPRHEFCNARNDVRKIRAILDAPASGNQSTKLIERTSSASASNVERASEIMEQHESTKLARRFFSMASRRAKSSCSLRCSVIRSALARRCSMSATPSAMRIAASERMAETHVAAAVPQAIRTSRANRSLWRQSLHWRRRHVWLDGVDHEGAHLLHRVADKRPDQHQHFNLNCPDSVGSLG